VPSILGAKLICTRLTAVVECSFPALSVLGVSTNNVTFLSSIRDRARYDSEKGGKEFQKTYVEHCHAQFRTQIFVHTKSNTNIIQTTRKRWTVRKWITRVRSKGGMCTVFQWNRENFLKCISMEIWSTWIREENNHYWLFWGNGVEEIMSSSRKTNSWNDGEEEGENVGENGIIIWKKRWRYDNIPFVEYMGKTEVEPNVWKRKVKQRTTKHQIKY